MKKTITIQQKQSGTGSIYDIASEHYDRVIEMGENYQFAVVLPSYYGADITRHRSENTAATAYKKLSREGYDGATIISRDGDLCLIDFEGDIRYESSPDNIIVAIEQPEPYRFETGTLYEYSKEQYAYVAVFTNAFCNTKAKAISAYEKII